MAGLPKFVLKRLRQESGLPVEASLGTGKGPVSALTLHPDPDVLCSFYERALPKQERARVLEHLSRCAECRQIATLAFPLREPEQQVSAIRSSRSLSRLLSLFKPRVLAWCAVAAAGVAVGFLIRSEVPLSWWHTDETPAIGSSAPGGGAESVTSPTDLKDHSQQNAAALLSAAEGYLGGSTAGRAGKKARTARPSVRHDTKQKHSSGNRKPSNEHRAELRSGRLAELRAPVATPFRASAPRIPAAALRPKTLKAPARDREVDRRAINTPAARDQISTQMTAVAPPAPVPTAEGGGSPETAKKMPDAAIASGMPRRSDTPNSSVPATTQGSVGGALWNLSSARARSSTVSRNAAPPAKSGGRLQRSLDGGKSWQQLHLDDSTAFRALYVSGSSVWVGGSGGALFHSSNGGASWTRSALNTGPHVNTDTIVEIGFSDPQHGELKTEAGETWTTSDGGLHWERKG